MNSKDKGLAAKDQSAKLKRLLSKLVGRSHLARRSAYTARKRSELLHRDSAELDEIIDKFIKAS